MIVELGRGRHILCDHCDEFVRALRRESADALRLRAARSSGWVIWENRDLCPRCAESHGPF